MKSVQGRNEEIFDDFSCTRVTVFLLVEIESDEKFRGI
jgi:hypothetical protein